MPMLDATPRVSVVMAVKNYPFHLAEAIEGILAQSMDSWELVVVDYGSTDGETLEIVRSCEDTRVRLVEWPGLTLPGASNVGLAMARGEYIARHDADDVSHPTRLATQVAFLEDHPDVDVLGTGYSVVGPTDRPVTVSSREWRHGLIDRHMPWMCCVCHGTVMARAEVFDSHVYNERMTAALDYGLWLSILTARCHRMHVIPDVLYTMHRHDGSITSTRRMWQFACAHSAREWHLRGREVPPERALLELMTRRGRAWRRWRLRHHIHAMWSERGWRRMASALRVALTRPDYFALEYRKWRSW